MNVTRRQWLWAPIFLAILSLWAESEDLRYLVNRVTGRNVHRIGDCDISFAPEWLTMPRPSSPRPPDKFLVKVRPFRGIDTSEFLSLYTVTEPHLASRAESRRTLRFGEFDAFVIGIPGQSRGEFALLVPACRAMVVSPNEASFSALHFSRLAST